MTRASKDGTLPLDDRVRGYDNGIEKEDSMGTAHPTRLCGEIGI